MIIRLVIRLVVWVWDVGSNIALGVFGACMMWTCSDTGANTAAENDKRSPVVVEKPPDNGRQLVIKADRHNQCYIEAVVKGANGGKGQSQRFRFLSDTGAALPLYFTMPDARKLGFDPSALSYDHTYEQWGGKVKGATVRLKEFRIGEFVLKDVEAVIDQTNWQQPLLGAPILKAMNFQMRDGACTFTLAADRKSVRPGEVLPSAPGPNIADSEPGPGTGGLY